MYPRDRGFRVMLVECAIPTYQAFDPFHPSRPTYAKGHPICDIGS
jgi:hypothetical protein